MYMCGYTYIYTNIHTHGEKHIYSENLYKQLSLLDKHVWFFGSGTVLADGFGLNRSLI